MTERSGSATAARWVLLAMVVGFAALAAVFAARGETSGLPVPWNVVVPLLPFLVFLGLLAPLVIGARNRKRPLLDGADAATRKAVNRAIQDGFAPESRIDELVVDLREHPTTGRLGLVATIQVVGALALGTAAIMAGEAIAASLLGLAGLAMLVAAGMLIVRRRRLLAFRPDGAPTAEPPAAAKGD
ncbi:hypothetical protein AB0J74_38545 [Asanoa sp. NPDC049573]|uniref:hypothetical protein n=1 Tax=Asanoa sp. NPDC049573 TaxID=3155396 RepID=UPI00341C313A